MARSLDYNRLKKQVYEALREWHRPRSDAQSPLRDLHVWRQSLHEIQQKKLSEAGGMHGHGATNHLLYRALKILRLEDSESASLLEMRFQDGWSAQRVANRLNIAESTVYAKQRQAVRRLATVIYEMEEKALAVKLERVARRTPPPTYVNLVGVQEHLDELTQRLIAPEPPWMFSVEGIGGIGKTALGHALLGRAMMNAAFDDCGWVSAQPAILDLSGVIRPVDQPLLSAEQLVEALLSQLAPETAAYLTADRTRALTALQKRLKREPHLIVIDNLETVTDLEALLPTLQSLANPSKFVLTTRKSLYSEPNLYHFAVPELNDVHALALIRQEARYSNLPALAESCDDELYPIYETVGGNPLALRLVVGQLHMDSPEVILDDLVEAKGATAENLYDYIYRRAWDSLDGLSQEVLVAMPLVSVDGDDLDYLAEVTGMSHGDLRSGLNKLITLNLVDGVGGLRHRRYRIHSLTRTFLHRQVVKWTG